MPAGQELVAQKGAAASPEAAKPPTNGSNANTLKPNNLSRQPSNVSGSTGSSFLPFGKSSASQSGLTVEVALKVIPRLSPGDESRYPVCCHEKDIMVYVDSIEAYGMCSKIIETFSDAHNYYFVIVSHNCIVNARTFA